MSSMRFRAGHRSARTAKSPWRIVEHLESRCVLSAASFYTPPMLSPSHSGGFTDRSAIEPSVKSMLVYDSGRGSIFAGDSNLITSSGYDRASMLNNDFGTSLDGMFSTRGGFNQLSASPPKAATTEYVVLNQSVYWFNVAGTQYQVVVFSGSTSINTYQSSLLIVPSSYTAVGPSLDHSVSAHTDPGGAVKPVVSPVSEPPMHAVEPPSGSGGAGANHGMAAEGIPVAPAGTAGAAVSSNTHAATAAQFAGGNLPTTGGGSRAMPMTVDRTVVHVVGGAIAGAAAAPGATAPPANPPRTTVAEAVPAQSVQISAAAIANAMTTDVPVQHAALAGLPLDLKAVEQALTTAIGRVAVLGEELNHWLDDPQLAPMFAAVTGAALGAGAACYFRRRNGTATIEHDEQVSSSWLFARMQSPFK